MQAWQLLLEEKWGDLQPASLDLPCTYVIFISILEILSPLPLLCRTILSAHNSMPVQLVWSLRYTIHKEWAVKHLADSPLSAKTQ
jgi:hypothetical protein